MKQTFLALSLLILSTGAYADLGEAHQEACESAEVKKLVGDKGSCRVVVAPKAFEKQGYCEGVFQGELPCVVSYISVKESAAANLTCGTDFENPILSQDMSAEALAYNVATLIKTSSGKDVVINDKSDYKLVSGGLVTLMFVDSEASVAINFIKGSVMLTDVKCN